MGLSQNNIRLNPLASHHFLEWNDHKFTHAKFSDTPRDSILWVTLFLSRKYSLAESPVLSIAHWTKHSLKDEQINPRLGFAGVAHTKTTHFPNEFPTTNYLQQSQDVVDPTQKKHLHIWAQISDHPNMKRFHSSYVLRRFTSPKYSDIYIEVS